MSVLPTPSKLTTVRLSICIIYFLVLAWLPANFLFSPCHLWGALLLFLVVAMAGLGDRYPQGRWVTGFLYCGTAFLLCRRPGLDTGDILLPWMAVVLVGHEIIAAAVKRHEQGRQGLGWGEKVLTLVLGVAFLFLFGFLAELPFAPRGVTSALVWAAVVLALISVGKLAKEALVK